MGRKKHSIDLLPHLAPSKYLRCVVVTLPLLQACHGGANLWQFSAVLSEPESLLTSEEKVEVSKDLEKYFQQDGHWPQPGHQLHALFNGWISGMGRLTAGKHIPLGFPGPEFPLKEYLPLLNSLGIRALAQEMQDLGHRPCSGRCWNHTFLGSESGQHLIIYGAGEGGPQRRRDCRRFMEPGREKLTGSGEMSVPNTVCAFDPVSLKWAVHRQNSAQEPEWETLSQKGCRRMCLLVYPVRLVRTLRHQIADKLGTDKGPRVPFQPSSCNSGRRRGNGSSRRGHCWSRHIQPQNPGCR